MPSQAPEVQQLDQLATINIEEFCKPYAWKFPFKIEHKLNKTFIKAAYTKGSLCFYAKS